MSRTLMIIGMTRDELFSNQYISVDATRISKRIQNYLLDNPDINTVVTGLNSGIELIAASAVLEFNEDYCKEIRLVCVYNKYQSMKGLNQSEREIFNQVIKETDSKIGVTPLNTEPHILYETMISISTEVLSFWNELKFKSDTYERIKLAYEHQLPIHNINPFSLVESISLKRILVMIYSKNMITNDINSLVFTCNSNNEEIQEYKDIDFAKIIDNKKIWELRKGLDIAKTIFIEDEPYLVDGYIKHGPHLVYEFFDKYVKGGQSKFKFLISIYESDEELNKILSQIM